jgi:hypothetical protein
MPSAFTNMPSGGGVSSPLANGGRRRCTSGMELWLGSLGFDGRRRLGRRGCRRAAVARLWQSSHLGSDSGEMRVNKRPWKLPWVLGEVPNCFVWRWERVDGRAHRGGGNGGRRSGVRAGRLTGCVFIGGTCTGASGECLSAHGGELRGGARQPTHASVAGGERGRGSGQWVGGTATGVCGAARGGFARGSRGNRIMSLGCGVEWPGADVEDGAAVRWVPRGWRVGARALWRPMGSSLFELHGFEIPKLLKIELDSKTYI